MLAGTRRKEYFDFTGLPFWIADKQRHELVYDTCVAEGTKCCFNHAVGLPEKEHLDLSIPHPPNFLGQSSKIIPLDFSRGVFSNSKFNSVSDSASHDLGLKGEEEEEEEYEREGDIMEDEEEEEDIIEEEEGRGGDIRGKDHTVKRGYDKEITYVKKHPIYDYELEVFDALFLHRKISIMKATGMGITELILRIMAWLPLHDPELYRASQFVITTGPNIELAKKAISRIYNLFQHTHYKPVTTETTININGCIIESFPSHHLDAARGLERCRFFFADEYDYFPPSQQEIVRTVAERYEAKSHPFIVLNSTPGLPGGLLDKLYRETNPPYYRLTLLYERGLNKIYTPYEISVAKQHPNFEREYNGKFGVGMGNIWPYQLVDAIMEDYPLGLTEWGDKVLAVDPGFGNSENSSQYAIVGAERINGVTYIKHALQFERASTSAMLDKTVDIFRLGYNRCLFDSSQPGLIRDLTTGQGGRPAIPVLPINFREHLGNMTVEAVEAVAQKKVRMHSKAHQDLAYQLKAATYNDRGHPDKRKMAFDLGDGFLMVMHGMKNANSYVIRPIRGI